MVKKATQKFRNLKNKAIGKIKERMREYIPEQEKLSVVSVEDLMEKLKSIEVDKEKKVIIASNNKEKRKILAERIRKELGMKVEEINAKRGEDLIIVIYHFKGGGLVSVRVEESIK